MAMITSEEAKPSNKQHRKPCEDCPFRRKSIPGWLGGYSPDQFLQMAHGETKYNCHSVGNQQCAGMAIYRANICKIPRDKTILVLPKNKDVFSWPTEFKEHHKTAEDLANEED